MPDLDPLVAEGETQFADERQARLMPVGEKSAGAGALVRVVASASFRRFAPIFSF
jgi:hypothetical protein